MLHSNVVFNMVYCWVTSRAGKKASMCAQVRLKECQLSDCTWQQLLLRYWVQNLCTCLAICLVYRAEQHANVITWSAKDIHCCVTTVLHSTSELCFCQSCRTTVRAAL